MKTEPDNPFEHNAFDTYLQAVEEAEHPIHYGIIGVITVMYAVLAVLVIPAMLLGVAVFAALIVLFYPVGRLVQYLKEVAE